MTLITFLKGKFIKLFGYNTFLSDVQHMPSYSSAPPHGLVKTDLLFSNGTPNPLFMEDVQTCIVPDDLFREDRPSHKPTNLDGETFAPTSPPFESHVEPNSARSFPTARNKPNRGFFKYRPKRGAQHQGNHD